MINSVAYNFNNSFRCPVYSGPRFCGASKGLANLNSTITKYLKKDNLSLLDRLKFQLIIMKNIFKLMKNENFIAAGYNAAVFRISDEYVSRHEICSKKDKLKISIIHKVENPFADIKSYYGAPLSESGFMKILRNAITDRFIPCGTPLHVDLTPPTKEEICKYEKEYIPLCASLPQESYDLLVSDVKNLGDRGFILDVTNPENIMISDNKFKIVDELKKTEYGVTLFDILKIILLKYSRIFYAEPKPDLFEARKEILRKSLIAGEKAGMQIGDNLVINEDAEYALEKLFYNNITDVCGIFDKLFYANESGLVSLEERIDMINKHFENINLYL